MPMPRGTGWAAREAAGKARAAAGTSPHLAENMRLAEEQRRRDLAEVEAKTLSQEAKRQATLCGCPACKGAGEVTESKSAFIASALAYYRSKNLAADPAFLQPHMILPRPGQRITAPIVRAVQDAFAAQAKVAEAQTDAEAAALAEAGETPKKARRIVPPPHLED